jgi:hypothetical protein
VAGAAAPDQDRGPFIDDVERLSNVLLLASQRHGIVHHRAHLGEIDLPAL